MRIAAGLLVLSLGETTAWAQSDPIKPLEWLVGEWDGKAKYGDRETDTRFVFSKALGDKFLHWRYRTLEDGKVAFESAGYLGWDLDEKKLVEFGFGMDGTIGWGRQEATEEKDTWVFAGKLSTNAPFKEVRKTIRRDGADKYVETVNGKVDGKWVELLKAEYTRRMK